MKGPELEKQQTCLKLKNISITYAKSRMFQLYWELLMYRQFLKTQTFKRSYILVGGRTHLSHTEE